MAPSLLNNNWHEHPGWHRPCHRQVRGEGLPHRARLPWRVTHSSLRWKIKLKGFRQISVRYLYPPVDQIVREYTQLKQAHIYRVVYLGPRHNTNLKTIRAYCQKEYDSRLKESLLYE